MKIDQVEAIPIEISLDKVFSGSGYRVTSRNTVITRIRTADGLVSEVYNGDNRAHGREIAKIVRDELAPLILGEDPRRIEALWTKMFALSIPNRDRKLVMEAIACVDTALWDLLGKSLGTNVATLLGGFRDRLPIIAIAAYYEDGKTLDDLSREMGWLREQGMAGCKVKVGGLLGRGRRRTGRRVPRRRRRRFHHRGRRQSRLADSGSGQVRSADRAIRHPLVSRSHATGMTTPSAWPRCAAARRSRSMPGRARFPVTAFAG
jgi:L-alanine-DL-glutamate epimerase-like enolase superfamily enzyme